MRCYRVRRDCCAILGARGRHYEQCERLSRGLERSCGAASVSINFLTEGPWLNFCRAFKQGEFMLNYLNSAVTVAETKDACVLCRRVFKDQDEKSSRLAEVPIAAKSCFHTTR